MFSGLSMPGDPFSCRVRPFQALKPHSSFQSRVIERMTCNEWNVYDRVVLDKQREERGWLQEWHYALIVGCSCAFLILFLIGSYFTHRRVQTNKLLRKKDWEIPIEDIIFYTTSKSATTGKSRSVDFWSVLLGHFDE